MAELEPLRLGFELRGLIEDQHLEVLSEVVMPPLLEYLLHRIQQDLQGRGALLTVDHGKAGYITH